MIIESSARTLKFITNHPLASKRPLAALARLAWWQVRSRLSAEVEYDWIEGSRLVVKRGMTGATGNIYCGLHEFSDMAFLLHLTHKDDLFIDIGANIGSYTILASAVCGARAIAVEPDPGTAAALRRNVAANFVNERVTVVEAALGALAGIANLTVGADTMNRILKDEGGPSQEVALETLDEVVGDGSPTIIKMDVEGYEFEVVAGGLHTLRNPSLLAVISENGDASVREPLESLGFKHYNYEPFSRQLHSGPRLCDTGNLLFIRDIGAVEKRIKSAPIRDIVGIPV
jgi:FkbM family methyltransferase